MSYFLDLIFDVSTPSPKADQQYCWYADMALRVVVHPRDGETPFTITLVAQTAHEKAAWLGDLKQVSKRFVKCSEDRNNREDTGEKKRERDPIHDQRHPIQWPLIFD